MASINKEGYLFIIILFLLSCASFTLSCTLGLFFLFVTGLCIYFFRDPVRVVPLSNTVIVSPADGVISKISEVGSPIDSQIRVNCISIFLNVLNVHVNRVPISGIIKSKYYNAGKFISANLDKSSTENERQTIVIETSFNSTNIVVEQIAGLIARRIVCTVTENQVVNVGERFGIIRFGSRVNIYIPINIQLNVQEGQTVIGGETVLADLMKELVSYESFKHI